MVPLKLIVLDLYHVVLHKTGGFFPYGGILRASPNPAATYTYLLTHEIYEINIMFEKLWLKGLINRPVNQNKFTEDLQDDLNTIELYPDIFKILVLLKKQGYELGVIANLTTEYQKPFFDRFLDQIISWKFFSSSLGVAKPDEQIYKAIWHSGFLPQEILIVGDNIRLDYSIPKKLGMEAILFNRYPQISKYSDEIKTIKSIQELPQKLSNLSI